jgi:hypothetical protein
MARFDVHAGFRRSDARPGVELPRPLAVHYHRRITLSVSSTASASAGVMAPPRRRGQQNRPIETR